MLVTITPEHANIASDYESPSRCLLATAIRSKYPNYSILCGIQYVWIDKSEYCLSQSLCNFLDKAYKTFPPTVNKPQTFRLTQIA